MRKVLFGLSAVVFVVSLLVGGYLFRRVKPLGFSTFPTFVFHLPITEGPQYMEKDDVYAAFYGNKPDGFLYSVRTMRSADEAVRREVGDDDDAALAGQGLSLFVNDGVGQGGRALDAGADVGEGPAGLDLLDAVED